MDCPVFGIYEKALPVCGRSFAEALEKAREAGYGSLEVSIDSTDRRLARLSWDARETEEFRKAVRGAGLQMLTMCLSGHKRFPLGHPDPRVVETGMAIMAKAIAFAERAGIRVIQLSGFDVTDDRLRTPETRRRYADNVAASARLAERACVTLAIEPVEGNLLDVRSTMEVVREVGSPFLQVYPDPANICSLGIDPVADLEYGRGHIAAVHMRDSLPGVFDATIPFGTGRLDFGAVLAKLAGLGFAGPMIVEMWNEDRPEGLGLIAQARSFLAQRIAEVTSHVQEGKEGNP